MVDTTTFPRPENWYAASRDGDSRDDGVRLYIISYLLTRTIVGVLGIALPAFLLFGEWSFLEASAQVRGSISAYYHSPVRDVFVACLCVIGFLLITYMAGKWRSVDFLVSFVAGVALILVALFPTERPNLAANAPACGSAPEPADCAPVQRRIGEARSEQIHYGSAAVAFGSLFLISLVFGRREQRFAKKPLVAWVHYACSAVIALGVLVIVVGELLDARSIWILTPLYVGEVLIVLAFGVSWLVKGADIRKALLPARRPA
jgi:hypothetical protein